MIEIQKLHYHYPDGTHAVKGVDLMISRENFSSFAVPMEWQDDSYAIDLWFNEAVHWIDSVNGLEGPHASRKTRHLVVWFFKRRITRLSRDR